MKVLENKEVSKRFCAVETKYKLDPAEVFLVINT